VSFEAWLQHTAQQMDAPGLTEDLIQEGRIAMWRNEQRRGVTHAGWMTTAARQRMRDVAWNGRSQWGSERGTQERSVVPVASVDEFEGEWWAPHQDDFAEWAALAYHHGELARAVGSLTAKQQECVRVVLAGGIMNPAQRAAWVDARRKLRALLQHLEETDG
jgi:DNA-directed RNA polymerase specialized sigma24 family protein